MNLKVAIGKSQKKNIPEAAREAALQCLSQIPEQEASLALVFSTPNFATPGLLKNIKQTLKNDVPLVGCSGMNIITPEGAQKEGLVLLLVASGQIKISCAGGNTALGKDAFLTGQALAASLLSNIKGERRELCLLFNDGLSPDTSSYLKGLQAVLGRSFPFIGGGSSDNLSFHQTFQFYNREVFTQGLSASLFAGKLSYSIGVRHGWKPLGKVRNVSESQGNVIKKIDGERASSLYEGYFAKTLAQLKKEILRINILYPIGLYLKGESEYLLRNVLSLNDDGSLTTQGDVPPGAPIRLMIGTKESALVAAGQAALEVKTGLRGKSAGLALVISSASRAYLLGRNINSEIKIVREVLGQETPLAGFYSYGEYAPLPSIDYYGQTYLHNQTIAILGIAGN